MSNTGNYSSWINCLRLYFNIYSIDILSEMTVRVNMDELWNVGCFSDSFSIFFFCFWTLINVMINSFLVSGRWNWLTECFSWICYGSDSKLKISRFFSCPEFHRLGICQFGEINKKHLFALNNLRHWGRVAVSQINYLMQIDDALCWSTLFKNIPFDIDGVIPQILTIVSDFMTNFYTLLSTLLQFQEII